MTFNPMRKLLQNLCGEVESMNILCLHNDVEIKAVKAVITAMENDRIERKFLRCLGLADKLQPNGTIYYKDRSKEILDMIDTVQQHYDDMKRRYLWALNRLADATLDLKRVTDLLLLAETRIEELTGAEDRLDLPRNHEDDPKLKDPDDQCQKEDGTEMDAADTQPRDEKLARYGKFVVKGVCARLVRSPKISWKSWKDSLDHSPMDEDVEADEQPRSRNGVAEKQERIEKSEGRGVSTGFTTRSPKITRLEDLPLRISAMVHAVDADDSESSRSKSLEGPVSESGSGHRQREASKADADLQVYALMEEIEEKDEVIRSLKQDLQELKDRLDVEKK